MLAFVFMNGANYKKFGYLMKNLSEDYALDAGKYPESVEDALQVLTLHEETSVKKKKQRCNDPEMKLSFAQNRKCFKCGKEGHIKKDCPELKSKTETEEGGAFVQSKNQHIGWAG